ncbi:PAS domain S-box protein [bacterium]|nr:PAS domain S-box protein [bacterium]
MCATTDDTADTTLAPDLKPDEYSLSRALSEAAFEAIFLSEKGVCFGQNHTAEKMFGYADDEAAGRMGTEWIDPADRDRVLNNMLEGVETPYEVVALRKDGTTFPCEIRGRMLDYQGRRVRVTALRDITERKAAEQALKESEHRYRALLTAIPDLIFVIDRYGVFIDHHAPGDLRLLVPPEEFIGRHVSEFMDGNVAELAQKTIDLVLRSGDVQPLSYSYEDEGITKHMESLAAPFGNDQVLFIVRNVTETVRLRRQENRAQRLEAAGCIAGQVAHDFNNLLGPLIGYPDLIRGTLPPDHPAREYVDCMEDSARQMAEINQQLLTLGRRGYYAPKIVCLDELVVSVVDKLPPRPAEVVVETDLGGTMPIMGGPAQIQRVVLNLVHNALDAVSGVGTITLSTRNVYLDRERSGFDHIPRGEYVQLSVADDGCGIDPAETDRIFEPFRTTKTVDRKRGSGLGLSVVKSVVEDHGGYVDVETDMGRGTTIQVLIPIAREQLPEPVVVVEPGRGESVLIVDDDALQRKIASHLLVELGYAPTAVASGEACLDHLASHPQDLVILDMIMPDGFDGAETYRRIIALRPEQRTLIVSGYAESRQVLEAQELGAGPFVRKPLTLETLGAAVRRQLDGRP